MEARVSFPPAERKKGWWDAEATYPDGLALSGQQAQSLCGDSQWWGEFEGPGRGLSGAGCPKDAGFASVYQPAHKAFHYFTTSRGPRPTLRVGVRGKPGGQAPVVPAPCVIIVIHTRAQTPPPQAAPGKPK